MSNAPDPTPPWRWPDEHWRGLVDRVRAGRRLHPTSWKDGARCAVALSFDSDHETNELRDGGGSVARLAWGDYGSRVGIGRILAVLSRQEVPATFFVPGVTALLHPDEQRRLVAEGHEVAMHGWIHEVATSLTPEEERGLMHRAADTLESITGTRPVGLRTPSFEISRDTLQIAEDMGLSYDASLMADDDCHEILLDGKHAHLIEIPAAWVRDDGAYLWTERFGGLRPYTPPYSVLDIFRRELDAAHAEGGLFQLVMHPHVIGYRSRIWILEEIIRHARALGGVWFATHAEIAEWCRATKPI
jgi:peptidoglycan/xylan/chitin deacetylase (PgdA/CDA1 family)